MKAHTQAVRHQVYKLVDSFLTHHRQALKNMGSEFITTYSDMVDGEKDPRNLMLLFQLDRVILLEFDVAPHIEVCAIVIAMEPRVISDRLQSMFDITFCYFPITFRPPPNDPYGITSDDLKLALRACVSATPHFAKQALPLFLEKYPTSSGPTLVRQRPWCLR